MREFKDQQKRTFFKNQKLYETMKIEQARQRKKQIIAESKIKGIKSRIREEITYQNRRSLAEKKNIELAIQNHKTIEK